jgi:hypothetical protein
MKRRPRVHCTESQKAVMWSTESGHRVKAVKCQHAGTSYVRDRRHGVFASARPRSRRSSSCPIQYLNMCPRPVRMGWDPHPNAINRAGEDGLIVAVQQCSCARIIVNIDPGQIRVHTDGVLIQPFVDFDLFEAAFGFDREANCLTCFYW